VPCTGRRRTNIWEKGTITASMTRKRDTNTTARRRRRHNISSSLISTITGTSTTINTSMSMNISMNIRRNIRNTNNISMMKRYKKRSIVMQKKQALTVMTNRNKRRTITVMITNMITNTIMITTIVTPMAARKTKTRKNIIIIIPMVWVVMITVTRT
jgi:hypothetical protein